MKLVGRGVVVFNYQSDASNSHAAFTRHPWRMVAFQLHRTTSVCKMGRMNTIKILLLSVVVSSSGSRLPFLDFPAEAVMDINKPCVLQLSLQFDRDASHDKFAAFRHWCRPHPIVNIIADQVGTMCMRVKMTTVCESFVFPAGEHRSLWQHFETTQSAGQINSCIFAVWLLFSIFRTSALQELSKNAPLQRPTSEHGTDMEQILQRLSRNSMRIADMHHAALRLWTTWCEYFSSFHQRTSVRYIAFDTTSWTRSRCMMSAISCVLHRPPLQVLAGPLRDIGACPFYPKFAHHGL